MTDPHRLRRRDRGLLKVKVVTAATVVGSIAAASAVAGMVSVSYASHAAAKPTTRVAKPPRVPADAPPVQQAPPTPETITKVVHVRRAGGYIQAPARAPAGSAGSFSYAAPPPPAPACVSTPSRPC